MKRCIFHYLEPILTDPKVGSALRPNRMLQAFKNNGYEVYEITGYSKDRKRKIDLLTEEIRNGVKFDFVYSESINSPTIFADEDHIPRHPFMDFSFLKYCRRQGIPVGLFYRDIYWKFPDIFNVSTTPFKRSLLIPLFQHDVKAYKYCTDVLYLPTERMFRYIENGCIIKPLPPAGMLHEDCYKQKLDRKKQKGLHIFYVGATSNLYDNRNLVQAVAETDDVYLTMCTPEKQWKKFKSDFEPFLCDRIRVIHESGEQLREYYENADVSAYCFPENDYLHMAMPIKIFESISYGTPILATSIYSISKLIQDNQIGWIAEPTVEGIKKQMKFLLDHPEKIREKTENTIDAAYRNTWEDRARQVAEDLVRIKR